MGVAVRCRFWRPLTPVHACAITLLTRTKRTRETGTGSCCHPCLLRSKKEQKHSRPGAAAGCRHSLGTTFNTFGASAPVPSPQKNWSPDSLRGSRLSFEWIAAGLTAVCFWTAPGRRTAASLALEGPVRFRLGLGSTLARLSPNRCLAGLPPAQSGAGS